MEVTFEYILENGSIQDLEDIKWRLMMFQEMESNYMALAVQNRIDELQSKMQSSNQ